MIIKSSKTKKLIGPMKIGEYKINTDFSAALIEINGNHGTVKCTDEDRIYFIIKGKGQFVINGKRSLAGQDDLIFIPKNTPYNIIGKMKYFLVCSPEFDPRHDIFLK